MQLTDFQYKLFHLIQVNNRMDIIRKAVWNLPYEVNASEYDIRSVLREYGIIQLHNFLAVKKALESDPVMKSKRQLKECLTPLTAPIDSHQDAIRDLRDLAYAHVGDKKNARFEGFMEELIEGRFPKNIEEIAFLADCVCHYVELFQANFRADFESVAKVEQKRPKLKRERRRNIQEIYEDVQEREMQASICLKDHGLQL